MDHYPLSGENVFPESITGGPGSTFFVGSLGTGALPFEVIGIDFPGALGR